MVKPRHVSEVENIGEQQSRQPDADTGIGILTCATIARVL